MGSSQDDQQQQNEHFNSEKADDPFALEPAPTDDPFASKSAPPKHRTPVPHTDKFLETYEEPSRWTHFQNKVIENPFAPAFLLLTVGALTVGLHHFRKGNQLKQQQM